MAESNIVTLDLETSYDNFLNYQVIKFINSGKFGSVWSVENKFLEKSALKRIVYGEKDSTKTSKLDIEKEIIAAKNLSHPNIIRFINFWIEKTSVRQIHVFEEFLKDEEKNQELLNNFRKKLKMLYSAADSSDDSGKYTVYINFELADSCLFNWLQNNIRRRYHAMVKWLIQIFDAVEFMHIKGWIHRDVKPQNILIKNEVLKLADFGLVIRIEEAEKMHEVGSKYYMAPEIKDFTKKYNSQVDVWSVGIVLVELMIPFHHRAHRENTLKNLQKLRYPPELKKERPQVQHVVEKLLSLNPKERPTCKVVKQLLPLSKQNDVEFALKSKTEKR